MFVCCECCVLSGRGLCDELITCPEESRGPALGRNATHTHTNKQTNLNERKLKTSIIQNILILSLY
jgi:hypothetical protein